VREAAAAALGRAGDPSALPALKQALKNKDEDEWVRLRIAQAISSLGDREGIPVLLKLAEEGDAKVSRLEAIASILKLTGSSEPPPADPDSPEAQTLIRKLDKWWSTDGPRLSWDPAARLYRTHR
jgi:HEAT repeat protein